MPASPPPHADDLEQLAADFLTEQAEAVYHDNGDQQLDRFSDAALADQLVTAGAGRLGKLDFERLVDAFGRLRVEGVSGSEAGGGTAAAGFPGLSVFVRGP